MFVHVHVSEIQNIGYLCITDECCTAKRAGFVNRLSIRVSRRSDKRGAKSEHSVRASLLTQQERQQAVL